ncbi:Na+/H+ antiporter NhaA [Geomonas sp. RF6]|uniref:Na+/H+ antiporter NhaA n=1 Tax=Geomonas sp. RF6 TaxID=2897342 RepID=UPI001E3C7D43|nr:Na+/H+ antiporter NhaA [Geomonas sp. RF6]UFS72843.1 Na+/H+ antiporter NhaA [Geomonas sp. RF6]
MGKHLNLLREFSIPLLSGVALALFWANLYPESYHHFVHAPRFLRFDLHFLTNDLFMVLFFGIAAAEITESCLPGGDLNPPRKALNALAATAGGVIGPAVVYLALNAVFGSPLLVKGWGIPTATDIALAWLVARAIFGRHHPAVAFLLLLAIADDAIGLIIIALFYPNPHQPPEPVWLLLIPCGMIFAWLVRRARVQWYMPYLVVGGCACWTGLYLGNLHPALALACVVPFLPHATRERAHLFEEDEREDSPLARFVRHWRLPVDFGMFLFGLVNAGVLFSGVSVVTWLVFLGLLVGKTGGIVTASLVAGRLGWTRPRGMGRLDLVLVALIAGIGFTVSLFIAGEAFADPLLQEGAKMGALFSIAIAIPAFAVARLCKVRRRGVGKF